MEFIHIKSEDRKINAKLRELVKKERNEKMGGVLEDG